MTQFLVALLGVSGAVATVLLWLRSLERKAIETERRATEREREQIAHEIRERDASIRERADRAHAEIDARPRPTTPEDRLAEIKRRNRT